MRTRVRSSTAGGTIVVGAATVAIGVGDSWRTALLALLAAGALALTRLRFAPQAGACVLALLALLVIGGHATSRDDRSPSDSGRQSHHPHHKHGAASAHNGRSRRS